LLQAPEKFTIQNVAQPFVGVHTHFCFIKVWAHGEAKEP
jgi:hypothetical protein